MLTQTFFKLFPPPKYLNIPYAGLDISDDAVRCIDYTETYHGLSIHKFGTKPLAKGVVEDGIIKDADALTKTLALLAKELNVYIVKASLPEERMYLFRTEVPGTEYHEIRQNIEFKLEENIPISPSEVVFSFDRVSMRKDLVSVSVAPLDIVTSYLEVIKNAGITVLSFDVGARAAAKALTSHLVEETVVLVHIMNHKTGIYIVCAGVVCFTSTVKIEETQDSLRSEIQKVLEYWRVHGIGTDITRIVVSGSYAMTDGLISKIAPNSKIPLEIAKVWQNAFSYDSYIPPISYEESLDYVVAAGLALP